LSAYMVGRGQNGPQFRTRDAEGCICIVKNLNDGHRAIGEAAIILTRSLKQFRLDKIEVCCGLQKLVRAMMLQGCRKADRAEVVERDCFATPNSLKSQGERNYFPRLVILVPKRQSCACLRGQYTLRKITRHSNQVPRLNLRSARGTAVPHFPRFRALALFGRRPPQRVDSLVMPAHSRPPSSHLSMSTYL